MNTFLTAQQEKNCRDPGIKYINETRFSESDVFLSPTITSLQQKIIFQANTQNKQIIN